MKRKGCALSLKKLLSGRFSWLGVDYENGARKLKVVSCFCMQSEDWRGCTRQDAMSISDYFSREGDSWSCRK